MRGKGDRILLWVSGCYQWSESGKQQYTRELLLFQKFRKDIEAARDCVICTCLSFFYEIGKVVPDRFIGDGQNGVRR